MTRGISVLGVLLALVSAASYAVAGPFGKALGDGGWSVTAVVVFRTGFGALVFAVPMAVLWYRARPVPPGWLFEIVRYGLIAIAGVQLCFYTALQYAPVATVLLIEYLAPVLLVGWTWARTRRRPRALVLVGAAVAVAGLALVIGPSSGAAALEPLGVLWAFAAATCLACYFGLAASTSERPPPTMVLLGGGFAVAAGFTAALALLGLEPLAATTGPVPLAGGSVPWWLPAGGLVLFAAVIAYLSGVHAIRSLGARRASFIALTEVLFAALVAWALLGEQPSAMQGFGALGVLAGVLLVQLAGDS